jgi:hypothetical protein
MMSYDWSVIDDVTSNIHAILPRTNIQSARSNTEDLLHGKSSPLRKELLVEEKGQPETKSIKAAEF